MIRRLWRWMTDPTEPEIKQDRTVEVAWLPLWQAHLVLHELWERDVPCVMVEDSTSHLRLAARGPMARIFVMEPRRARAAEIIELVTGVEPSTLVR
jgi:hypothetical protein